MVSIYHIYIYNLIYRIVQGGKNPCQLKVKFQSFRALSLQLFSHTYAGMYIFEDLPVCMFSKTYGTGTPPTNIHLKPWYMTRWAKKHSPTKLNDSTICPNVVRLDGNLNPNLLKKNFGFFLGATMAGRLRPVKVEFLVHPQLLKHTASYWCESGSN